MKKIKINKLLTTRNIVLLCFGAFVLVTMASFGAYDQHARARDYDAEISAKESEIAAFQAEAARLAGQADSLSVALESIENEKGQIQAQVNVSQTKYDKLIAQIAETNAIIASNQDALGKTIADMYVEGQVTPLEMLASSKNISEFMDKQEYRTSIRNQLTTKISEIKALNLKLNAQKKSTENILSDQKSQRDYLALKEDEHQGLIDQTKGQESAYQDMARSANSEISQLRSLQAAELAARAKSKGGQYSSSEGDGSRGGYPLKWLSAGLDAYIDDWGMYTRECVSYVAFRVNQAYGNMPYWGGRGNAWQWAISGWVGYDGTHAKSNTGWWHTANTQTDGIPTGNTPKAGSVGVIDGRYGHVVWVESVNADGTVNISQFNNNWSGEYSEWYNVSPTYFDTYIYFGER